MGSWKLWGGNSVLGRKLGARIGLCMSELTAGAAGLRVLSKSCPRKAVGAADGAAEAVGAARGSGPAGSIMRGELARWGSGLGTTA